jgi:hypothetical protein
MPCGSLLMFLTVGGYVADRSNAEWERELEGECWREYFLVHKLIGMPIANRTEEAKEAMKRSKLH